MRRRGFTLIEAVVSMVIVSVMLLAALETAGLAAVGRSTVTAHEKGMFLARDLMSEIMGQPFDDPEGMSMSATPNTEAGEKGSGRSSYDDVDDYFKWSASPPQYKDGTEMSGMSQWRRESIVYRVQGSDLSTKKSSGAIKRIEVRVYFHNRQVAELIGFRAEAMETGDATREGNQNGNGGNGQG